MKLKKLTPFWLAVIYYWYLFWDFPPMERRPLRAMHRLGRQGRYSAYIMSDESGNTAAYAAAAKGPDGSFLLDYLAVCRGQRGIGKGTQMLELLLKEFSGKPVFVEIEDPDAVKAIAEKEQRLRRLRFYRRCSFRETGIRCSVYGVRYRILLSDENMSDEKAYLRLDALYRAIFSKSAYDTQVRFLSKID